MEWLMQIGILVLVAIGTLILATIVLPLLSALGGFIFGTVLFSIFPFAGVWVATGLRKFGFDIQPADLPFVFAALAVVASYFRSTHTTSVKK